MKKLITLALAIILAMSTTMPVMAEEKDTDPIFEVDLSVCKDGELSVYRNTIREIIKEEWADCNCVGMCECTLLFHVLEDTTETDFYSAYFNDYLDTEVYLDCSSSMILFFRNAKIIENISTFLNENKKEIQNVFHNGETNLYGLLNSFETEKIGETIVVTPEKTPIIITDLWDTSSKEESFYYWGNVVFCVPYKSTDKEGVLHCENVVNDLLTNHSLFPRTLAIVIVYTDEVIVSYREEITFSDAGMIEIYVP